MFTKSSPAFHIALNGCIIKNKLHIVHISSPLDWRGGEQQAFYLMLELKKLGVSQSLVCHEGSVIHQRAEQAGITCLTAPKKRPMGLGLRAVLSTHKSSFNAGTVWHAHDSKAHTAAVMSLLNDKSGIPVVASRRVDFPVKRSPLSLFKYNHASVKRIVCVSDEIKRITAPAIRNSKVLTTIHSGIDPNRFDKRQSRADLHALFDIPETHSIVINVAALAPHKDYMTFISAAELVLAEKPNTHFIAFGEGPSRPGIEKRLNESPWRQNIRLAGFRNDVSELMPFADVFMFSSETEGLGTSVIDAMYCSLPISATKAGGVPELIHHESNGLLAPVHDPKTLAENTLALLNDAALAKALSAQAHKDSHNFLVAETATKTLKLYEDVLSESGS